MIDQDMQALVEPVRIRFGPAAGNELHIDAATKGLEWLYRHRPQSFADMMLAVYGLDFETKARRGSAGG